MNYGLLFIYFTFFSDQTLTAWDTWQMTVRFIRCCHLWPLQSLYLHRRFILFIALNRSFSFRPVACVTSPYFEVSTTVVLFNSNSVGDSSCYPERGQVCRSLPQAVSNCLPVWHRPRVNVALNKCECVCVRERGKPTATHIADPLLPFNPANPKLQTACRPFCSDLKKAGSSSEGSLKIKYSGKKESQSSWFLHCAAWHLFRSVVDGEVHLELLLATALFQGEKSTRTLLHLPLILMYSKTVQHERCVIGQTS